MRVSPQYSSKYYQSYLITPYIHDIHAICLFVPSVVPSDDFITMGALRYFVWVVGNQGEPTWASSGDEILYYLL